LAPSLDTRQRASCITLDQHANRRNLATAPAKTPLATDRRTARTRAPRSRRLIPPESRAIWKLRGTGSEWPTTRSGRDQVAEERVVGSAPPTTCSSSRLGR